MWVCPIQTNFLSPPGHPTNNSVRHYLSGLGGRSYKLRVQSHRTAPISDANCKSQFATCASERLAINWGSYNPILGFGNLLEWLTELRETHLLVYCIIKGVMKETDEQADKGLHCVGFGRILSTGAMSWGVGMCHPSST